jgi:hypothetical protein
MTDEDKALQREARKAFGYNDEQIAAQEREDALMSRPDSDSEKITTIFHRALNS